jgi:SAM-dependent methyltransferase
MSKHNDLTVRAYESGLAEYNAAMIPEVTGSVRVWIDFALELLVPGSFILELGSAHGRDANYIESKGFTVDRSDAAEAFVKYLQKQGRKARYLDALKGGYGGPFDMVYANSVLLHFTSREMVRVFKSTRNALNPEGLFVFSVKVGDGSGWKTSKLRDARYFTYWREKALREFIEAQRYEVIWWQEGSTGHDNSDHYHVITRPR